MKTILSCVSVVIESLGICIGSFILGMNCINQFYSDVEYKFGLKGGAMFIRLLLIILAFAAFLILTERRKEIGDKMHTVSFITLNLFSLAFCGIIVWMFLFPI